MKAATCTEAGERTRTCSKCGEVETATVAALGHDLGAIIPSKEATCTEDGYAEHYHCARCGKDFAEGEVEITSAIPAVGHQTETVPETRGECSDGVLAHEHCSVCGKNFIDGVEKTDDELRIPGNHTLESVSEVPSNCTDEGTLAHEHCSVCGKNFIDGVEKTDDELKIPITHALESVSEVPSNCTDEGTLAHEHCTLCGKNFINGVEKTDDELKIPISHTLVIVPEVPATCTADGTIAHLHCTVCGSDFVRGEVKTAEELKIPASHSLISVPEVEATCTDDGTMAHERCTVCGKTFVGGVEKTASELVTTASHTLESVSAVPATCTDSGTLAHEHCTVCGSNFIDGVEKTDDELTVSSVGHAYGDLIVESGERNHYQCSECGKYFDENYLEITVLVIPTGHNFSEWTFEVPATCYATGTKGYFTCSDEGCAGKYFDIDYNEIDDLTIPVAHKLKPAYEYNSMYHYSVCTVCHGVIDEEEHALTTVYNQTDGQWYTYEECTVCGYKGDPIPFEKVESIVAENSFLIGTDNKDSFWVTVCTETGNYYTDCIRWYLCDPDAFDAMVAELETLGADSFPVKRTVSLCYYNFTAEIEITIDIPRTVAVPEYPVYQKGYLENLDNLMVKLLSNDGNEQFIYLYETIIIDNGGFDPNYDFADGDKVYTVSFAYDEEAYTFSFTFVDRAVVREIRCCADKVDCGTYPEIALNYSDGTTKYTDVLSVFDMVSGSYDKDTLGKQTFTLRSGDGFATAEVTVEVVDPRGIASVPDRVFIPLGTDPFEVSVTYNDGTEGVETVTQYAIIDPDLYGRGTPFDSSVVGEYHVIVRIGDRDAELRIYVYDPENKEVSEIYFTFTEPLVCENGGDGTPVIDLTGLYIVAVLNDGTEEIVPLTQDMLTYGEAGDDFFTVTYRGKEATVHFIESEKTVQEISVHGKDGNQAYALFIKNGVPQDEYWVKVTTSDYAYYYLALTADMIYRDGEAFDISTAASDGYDITVTYQGASCSLTLFIYTDADIEKSLYCGNDGTIVCGSEESVLSQIADM
ncbi:MAG: hypothetical protein ACI3XE_00400, partial [Eubacteriales bacterium]